MLINQLQQQTQPQIVYQLPQLTQVEEARNNAIFLSQNKNTKYFHITSFMKNFVYGKDYSNYTLSKESLNEQENEKSPLFFKLSGSVAFCSQVGGCCIFYNNAITEQQMKILYSLQCQSEIFDSVCKLYENSIPNYTKLFHLTFSSRLSSTFRLLGLSEDTLLLKIIHDAPSQRNKFMYNAALMQLQMLRFDFIISPNLTQYYVKQFLDESLCNNTNINSDHLSKQTIENNIQPQLNITDAHNTPQFKTVNASAFSINHKRKIKCVDEENKSDNCSESCDSSSNSSSSSDYESEEDEANKNILEQEKNQHSSTVVINKKPNTQTLYKRTKRLSSIVSTEASSLQPSSKQTATSSSVDFIIGSNKSDTGLTSAFTKLMAPPIKANSTTGLTRNISDLDIDSPELEYDERYTFTPLQTPSVENVLSVIEKKSVFDCKEIYKLDRNGRKIYNPRYLKLHQYNQLDVNLQELFADYEDLHSQILAYVQTNQLDRFDPISIDIVYEDLLHDEMNRLKQAVYIYLISSLLEIRNN